MDNRDRRREAIALRVLTEYAELPIDDSSGFRRGVVLLSELGDPEYAIGNCGNAVTELVDVVGPEGFDALLVEPVLIASEGFHIALRVEDADGTYIVDFTVRQFSLDLPFPFVATIEAWIAAIANATRTAWQVIPNNSDEG